mmetsp:Transcript_18138/g.52929  ORF Transcript_18138/g.52929 Transcript_18138/m.52929 type:complete len:262 (+) Transcript_18138:122-907(+)
MPRVPAASALAAATRGLELFRDLTDSEWCETKGTLVWLLFSPTTRDGADNSVYDETRAFAAGELNPNTGFAYPYRCWYELAEVVVAGGAKYARPRLRSSSPSSTDSRGSRPPRKTTSHSRRSHTRRAAARTRRWMRSPWLRCAAAGQRLALFRTPWVRRASGHATPASPRTASWRKSSTSGWRLRRGTLLMRTTLLMRPASSGLSSALCALGSCAASACTRSSGKTSTRSITPTSPRNTSLTARSCCLSGGPPRTRYSWSA